MRQSSKRWAVGVPVLLSAALQAGLLLVALSVVSGCGESPAQDGDASTWSLGGDGGVCVRPTDATRIED